jgi:hypothetical protein
MGNRGFTYLLFSFAVFVLAAISSCQKDPAVNAPASTATSLNADSSMMTSAGNSLAVSGTLTVKFNDSVYTFDASRDSIAFINVRVGDDSRYFGITAINKEHTMSFGVSSAGYAYSNITRDVAGSQLLLSNDDKKPALQLSLSKYSAPKDLGNITLAQYRLGNELSKGTFVTFLAKDDKANSPYYRVEGAFDLQFK